MELPMRRLTRKIDEDGNSILHTVGKESKDYVPEKMQGPALELQDELRWFEVLHFKHLFFSYGLGVHASICSKCKHIHTTLHAIVL